MPNLFNWWFVYFLRLLESLIKPLNAQLNPICHLLALLGSHHILHVNRIRVKKTHNNRIKVKTCNALLHTLLVRIRYYLKAALRYKFLILDTYNSGHTIFTSTRIWGSVVIFRNHKGSASKEVWAKPICFNSFLIYGEILQCMSKHSVFCLKLFPSLASVFS